MSVKYKLAHVTLILLITRSCDPQFTRNDLISMEEAQEITFGIFEILLNFFIENGKMSKFPISDLCASFLVVLAIFDNLPVSRSGQYFRVL